MRLVVKPCWACNLDYREALAIRQSHRLLNRQRPAPSRYWSPMVWAEDAWRALPWVVVILVAISLSLG
jgi:hypothetical protein